MKKKNDETRRVLFELSITPNGSLEVRLDESMKPLTILAVASALDTLSDELKAYVDWEGLR